MSRHACLNRAYRLVWDAARHLWIVVAETARAKGKGGRTLTLASGLALASGTGWALPTGGVVTAGEGVIGQDGAAMTINQQTGRLAIDWQGFSIGATESVRFVQPDAGSIALNRVVTQNPSQILGRLDANGQVFVLNPNGVLFGAHAQVAVGGLVASTLGLSNTDFLAGKFQFSGTSAAMVTNQGRLTAADGGYVALLGAHVGNDGVISATGGDVALAAGNTVTLQLDNGSLAGLSVDRGSVQALVASHGLIQADGGQVLLTAQAADSLARAVVNHDGIIEARTIDTRRGEIRLLGDMDQGEVRVSGRLDASAPQGGQGGFIESSAATVTVADSAQVDTHAANGTAGTWLIDPADFTISDTDGDISATALSAALDKANVEIRSTDGKTEGNGDIVVNDRIGWTGDTTLTLTAERNIAVNADISAAGKSAGFVLTPGSKGTYSLNNGAKITLSGASATLNIMGQDYVLIHDILALQNNVGTGDLKNSYFALAEDIDATETKGWNRGYGFRPIGTNDTPFTGVFNGLGHTVSNLVINDPASVTIGLFGNSSGVIKNVHLTGAEISAGGSAGALVGINQGTVLNSSAEGKLSAINSDSITYISDLGGLVGVNYGSIGNSSAHVVINADANGAPVDINAVGGLVGTNAGTITDSYATGDVIAESVDAGGIYGVGGLAGYSSGVIDISGLKFDSSLLGGQIQVSASIDANNDTSATIAQIGGLVGQSTAALTGNDSYSAGAVTITNTTLGSTMSIGGAVGANYSDLTGVATSQELSVGGESLSQIGGLVGYNKGNILSAVAEGDVSVNVTNGGSGQSIGGLVGDNNGYVADSRAASLLTVDTGAGGIFNVGGLAGYNRGRSIATDGTAKVAPSLTPTITDSVSTVEVSVSGGDGSSLGSIGGLVGRNAGLLDLGGISTPVSGGSVSVVASGDARAQTGAYISNVGGVAGANQGSIGLLAGGNTYTAADVWIYNDTSHGVVGTVGGVVGGNDTGGVLSHVSGRLTVSVNDVLAGEISSAGGIVGSNAGSISDATGTINLLDTAGFQLSNVTNVGGIAGFNTGTLSKVSSASDVRGTEHVGGLVGFNTNTGSISDSYATGRISFSAESGTSGYFGGLVGENNGLIQRSYFDGTVTGPVGVNDYGTGVGGIAGMNGYDGVILNSYAHGTVTGDKVVGGLVGYNQGKITSSYANTAVSGTDTLGGLIGSDTSIGGVTSSFFNLDLLSFTDNSGYGRTTDQLRKASTFSDAGWDIATTGGSTAVWRIYEGQTAPLLRGFLTGLTVTASDQTVVYDGTTHSGGNGVSYSLSSPSPDLLLGDAVYGGDSQGARNAGSYTLDVSGLYSSQQGYDISFESGKLVITPKTLSVSVSAQDKVYDGSTAATVNASLEGLVSGDTVSVDVRGAFADKNVGAGKRVEASYSLGGSDAGNYTLFNTSDRILTASITPKALTIDGSIAAGKTYDGTTAAAVTAGALEGLIDGDAVAVSATGVFADKHAGLGKSVFASYSLEGSDGGNYTLGDQVLNADITARALNGLITASGKTYDGTTAASTSGSLGAGVVAGDELVFTTSGVFADKRAGLGKQVDVSGSLDGADSGNYVLTTNTTTTADIARRDVTGLIVASGKTYDGTTTADTGGVLGAGVIGGDDVAFTTSGTFADKNAGESKTVSVSGSLGGADGDNYALNANTTATATITQKSITGTIKAGNKVYDGTTAAATLGMLSGAIAGDDLSFATSGSFADKNAGTAKTVTVTGGLSGADQGNYTLSANTSTTADITQRALNGLITAQDKTYDGTTQATVSGSLSGAIAGDNLVLNASGNFATKNVGVGKRVALSASLGGTDRNNYVLTTNGSTTATISAKALSASITAADRVYDGTTAAATTGSLSGAVAGDNLVLSTSGSFADKNVGADKQVSLVSNLGGADAGNYVFTSNSTTTADITARTLHADIVAGNKVYDATTAADIDVTLSGFVTGDDLAFMTSASFTDKHVGVGKTVTIASSLGGADSGNYVLDSNGTSTADITARAITGTISAQDKVYDGTTAVQLTGGLSGALAGDDLSLDLAGAFADKHAGLGKQVNVTGSLGGADSGNYVLTTNATTSADIQARALTGLVTAQGKTYDGTTVATTAGSLSGAIAGDDLVFTTSGAFTDKRAGAGKLVNVASSLGGADSGNYVLSANTTTTATIAAKGISAIITVQDKVYDGSIVASTSATLSGVIAGDSVGMSSVGSFIDKNAGTGKLVNLSTNMGGADKDNYVLQSLNTTAFATITPKTVTGAITALDKVYDGSTAAATNGVLNGVLIGDSVTFATSGNFLDKNVGAGKLVNVTGSLGGVNGGNYVLDPGTTTTSTASITPKAITGAITAQAKVYDGTTAATLAGNLSGVVAGDDLVVSVSGAFADKQAGLSKLVNVSGSLSGADQGNYILSSNATTTADISARTVSADIAAAGKVYDGTTTAATSGSLSGVLGGDDLQLATSGSFADKNAGTGKRVNVSGSLTGADSGNYVLSSNATATADISAKAITGSITADNKIYDGTTAATLAGSLNGVISGDDLRIDASGSFADKHVGTGKRVTISGGLGGADSGNYVLSSNTTTTANISAKAITGSITAGNKTYDATTAATLAGSLNGAIAGDDLVFTTGGAFADKHAGLGKLVNVTGSLGGADSGNYTLSSNTTTTADIAAKAISADITAAGKVYDGSTAATTGGSLSGAISGDDLMLSTSGSFADKNAGLGKLVNVTGSLAGADSGNYVLTSNATTTADISAKAISADIVAAGKVYDGTTSANTSGSLSGAISGDDLLLSTSGGFADKNAGMGKRVNVTGSLGGADSGNYVLASNATTTADISAKALSADITAAGKVYDGTTSVNTSGSLSGAISGDDLMLSTSGSFADKNAGLGKLVNVTGSLAGADSGNYVLASNATTTADISAKAISADITAAGKVYDGSTAATTSGSLSGAISGDDLMLSTSGSFADKNAGTGKRVNVTGSLAGADSGNYVLASNATTTADISAKAISADITAAGKVYDGSTAATTGGSLSGAISGDDLMLSTSGSFADKNAGLGKLVNVTGSLAGADSGNYVLTSNTTTTADITARTLLAGVTARNKVYDGTTAADLDITVDGFVTGDDLAFMTSASFADKNAGASKLVNITSSLGGADSGNYLLSSNSTTTADIAAKAITGSISADNKVYDGTTAATLAGSLSGAIAGDDLVLAVSGAFADRHAGLGKRVNVSGSLGGADQGNYVLTSNTTTTADISAKTVSADITAAGKVYDGTTAATTSGSLNGVISGDDLQLATSGSFADKHAGSGKLVNVTGSLGGADQGNYVLTSNATTTADISAKAITGAITAEGKTYDGTTLATVSGSLSGVVSGDDLQLATSGSFADKHAGSGKLVNVTGSLDGADSGNYVLASNATTTADISAKAISADISAAGKVYDGTTAATTSGTLNGVISGDDLQLATSGSFADKNAGSGKLVNVTGSLGGADSGNYVLASNATTTADISAKAISADITAAGKVYDGATTANTSGTLNGVISGDDLQLATSGSFADKTAGTGKLVNVTGSLAGTDSGNYVLTSNATTTADITARTLLAGVTARNKVYDATTAADIDVTLSGFIDGDDLAFMTSASFVDKHAGTGKQVNITSSLGGADSGNYLLSSNSTATADITARDITGSITAGNKTYDGTTAATLTGSLSGVISGDDLQLDASGSFADKNAGVAKLVNVSGSLGGADQHNYVLTSNATTTADIAAKAISADIAASGKVYDGATTAVTSGSLNGMISGDDLQLATSGSFADKNAGVAKLVNVSGSLDGADQHNYVLSSNTTTTADISAKSITGLIIAGNKTYDGTTQADISGSLNGMVSGDDLSFATSGAFADKNAGTGKLVNVSGSLGGADQLNYVLASNTTTTADIAAKAISADISAAGKVYDGTTTAVTSGSLSGLISGDDLQLATSGSFADKNAGKGKLVSVIGSLGGADSGNYALSTNATTTADITAKALAGAITAQDKTYDGTTAATLAGSLSGMVSGDDLILDVSGAFADKNAGSDKLVNVSGSLGGTDSGNYVLTSNTTTTADIAAKAISADISASGKVYDGTTTAVTSGSLNGLISGDDLQLSTSGSFADKHAGLGKLVNVSGSLGGADQHNYVLSSNATTTADISAKSITGLIIAGNKTYDGTTQADISGSLNGMVSGDDLSFTTSGAFADKNAGTGKLVSVSGSLGGADQLNYVLASNTTTTADIAAKAISADISAAGKVYDGTTTAVTSGSLSGLISGDDLQLATSGSFADKHAGVAKLVNVSGSLGGADSGNYALTTNATTTADISARAITGLITAGSKVYDGTTQADVGGSLSGTIAGDDLVFTTGGAFADKNAGLGKLVNVSGSLGGADQYNYVLSSNATTTADISAKALTGLVSAQDKVYDGTTAATVSGRLSGLVLGDDLALTLTGSFTDKQVGTGKLVTVGVSLGGADSGNYVLSANTTTSADITPRDISTVISAAGKVYDGSTAASTSGVLSGVLAGDQVDLATLGSFTDKNAGVNKQVNVSASLGGLDKDNYRLASNSTATATITPRAITGAITAQDKVYDRLVTATTQGSLTDVVSGDDLQLSTSGSFADRNVGTGKQVSVSGSLAGVDSGNYVLGGVNATTTASITPKALTGVITAASKVYNSRLNATTQGSLSGVISGDSVGMSTSGSFADKNVGVAKQVSVTGNLSGADKGNYVIGSVNATTTADITPAALVIQANDAIRVAGAANPAFSSSINDILIGDNLTGLSGDTIFRIDGSTDLGRFIAGVSGRPVFHTTADASAAPGQYAITMSGLSAANYQISYLPGTLTVVPDTTPVVVTTPLASELEAVFTGAEERGSRPVVPTGMPIQNFVVDELNLFAIEADGIRLPDDVSGDNFNNDSKDL